MPEGMDGPRPSRSPLSTRRERLEDERGKITGLHEALSSSVLFNGFLSLVNLLADYETLAKTYGFSKNWPVCLTHVQK